MLTSSLFLPESAGTFLSGWYFLASSIYLLLTCLSETFSLRLNAKIPSKSLRFIPTPSALNLLLFCRGGREGGSHCYVGVDADFFGGVEYFLAS